VRSSLHPEAQQDLRDAARFYRDNSGPPMAKALLAEFERTLSILLRHPGIGTPQALGRRRFALRRFPYSVVYVATDDHLRVLAVAHHSRLPDYWRDRE